jgi:cobyric acid synthase
MTTMTKSPRHRIGLVYVPGALPCFEAFGNLPTNLVREDGLVGDKPASEALDMLIIPGGSLVESQTVKGELAEQILRMADAGKFVLGICSGFQILSRGTDIGRLSPTPIFRKGLGLLDAEFKPLICTDQVTGTVTGESFLSHRVGADVSGFHCHTYGDIALHKEAKPILVSHVTRLNYRRNRKEIVSGVCNTRGNVVGITMHALLDENPALIGDIVKSLQIDATDLQKIRIENAKLQATMKQEIGISTNLHANHEATPEPGASRALLVTALESGSGKTFIITGIAAALKKRGVEAEVIKVGGDIRDIVPALYLIKQPMTKHSSIRVAGTGWRTVQEVVRETAKPGKFLLIEGAMNAFTGLLYEGEERPNSTAEAAAAINVPTVVVTGCDTEGVEGGVVNALSYARLLRRLSVPTAGVILNKVYMRYLSADMKRAIEKAFAEADVELLGIVPCIENLEERGLIPEVEIKYEEFGAKALATAEESININKIITAAAPPLVREFDYGEFVEKFKAALTEDYRGNSSGKR